MHSFATFFKNSHDNNIINAAPESLIMIITIEVAIEVDYSAELPREKESLRPFRQ